MKPIIAAILILMLVSSKPPQVMQTGNPTMSATLTATVSGTDEPSTLRALADKRGFYIGTAIAVPPLLNVPDYRTVVSREYNIVVPENVMKWDATELTQGHFQFLQGDEIVSFAEANRMKVRGHNLVWHQQLPGWLGGGKFTHDQLLDILHTHITGLVTHYKGRILAWDVVNEAVSEDGSLRKDLWSKTFGPDYIEQAFRFAHEADPGAKLFYNDYGGEGKGRKSDAIYDLVKGLKDKGVPIDGVGLQMHIGIGPGESPNPEDIASNMKRLAALGLEVQITEMDVKIQNGARTLDEKLAAQAATYADILRVCTQQPACTAFLTWGFTDLYTWIPGFTGKADAPLPFDKMYQPKPAYAALLNVLTEQ